MRIVSLLVASRASLLVATAALMPAGCARSANGAGTPPFEIVARFPHDTAAYTQGLLLHDGLLYESTGRYGQSEVRRVIPRSGRVTKSVRLPSNRFGEGLTLHDGRLFQLTWESHIGYIYDVATLAQVDSFPLAGEGWGLTSDGTSLIVSDGSDSLRFISPSTFELERVVHVKHRGSALSKLNELEWVNGDVLANVYESDWIARIDPASGEVKELLDFSSLYPKDDRPRDADVLNGIAQAATPGHLYITGKLWPVLFEVRLR
jgi:glutaminyl-peptide cyclotransferase